MRKFIIENSVLIKYTGSSKKVTVPEGVRIIGQKAFAECKTIERVVLPNSVVEIEAVAFFCCEQLESIKFPSQLISIKTLAFFGCKKLKRIFIPNGTLFIGAGAFYGCFDVELVKIPASVVKIEKAAFLSCGSLRKIIVSPDNQCYRSIEGNLYDKEATILIMYAGGRYVEEFMIPETVTLIEDGALECCNWLLNIRVEEKNPVYKSIDGNLYSKDGTKLIQYPIGKRKKHFRIPDSVVSIHCDAFSFCNLESIIIPKNVQIIESGSFEGCWRLTIYCEIESQPNNWDEDWNPDNRPVFWKCELKK